MTVGAALIPFGQQGPDGLVINAAVAVNRQPGPGVQLLLRYTLRGAAAVLFPAPSTCPQRRDGLWQHTCLEAFLAPVGGEDPIGEQPYWEFNLAPSGDWNVYRLETYRQGLRPEPFITELPFSVERPRRASALEPHALELPALELSLSCSLPPPLAGAAALQVGLSAVIEDHGGQLSYWALSHPGPEADFHHRGGWTLRL